MRLALATTLAVSAVMAPVPAFAQASYQDPACPTTSIEVLTPSPVSGQDVSVRVVVRDAPATSTVSLFRESPAPAQTVREGQAENGSITWTLRLGENHTLRAGTQTPIGCVGGEQGRATIAVKAAVSIAAKRNSVRDYTFTGRVQPGYGSVALYRVEGSRRVLTSRANVQPNGTYRIDRRFTGSGRFGFVAVANPGSTGRYVAGESTVRPTVIH